MVLGEHLGDEAREAALAGGRGEVLEQDRPETPALVVVAHDERDLGRRGLREPHVAPDGDDLAAEPEHEGHAVVVVDLDEVLEVALGDVRVGAEVAEVAGPVRQPAVERDHVVRVVGRDRAQVCRRAVGGHDVGLLRCRRALPQAKRSAPLPAIPVSARGARHAIVPIDAFDPGAGGFRRWHADVRGRAGAAGARAASPGDVGRAGARVVVDAVTMKEVGRIPVGQVPKRNATAILQVAR